MSDQISNLSIDYWFVTDVTQPNLTDLRSSDVDIVLSIAGLQTTRALQGGG